MACGGRIVVRRHRRPFHDALHAENPTPTARRLPTSNERSFVTPGRVIQNIALIGFMGAGKSSVGQLLAHQLHLRFIDTDHRIEQRVGKPISRIFAEDGEACFRACEEALVGELAQETGAVIATGGGLGANPQHLERLKTHALVVWLWASAEALWERVHHQTHRPLLQTEDPLARIRALLAEREPVYRLADLLVNTEMRSGRELVHQIAHEYHAVRARPN